jgi:hypothetical protein
LIVALGAVGTTARAQDSGTSAGALRQQIIGEAASQATRAQFLGRVLFRNYSDRRIDDSETGRAAVKAATAAVTDRCKGSYRVVLVSAHSSGIPSQIVPLENPDDILAYVIGEPPGAQQVMLGRHYRVDLSPDGKTVRSIAASTADCAVMALSALTHAPYIRHRLTNGPTEFHVFLSLLHKAKFRVHAPIGIFEIDNGEVTPAALDPAYRPETVALKDCKLPNSTTTFRTTEAACRKAGGTVQQP